MNSLEPIANAILIAGLIFITILFAVKLTL